MSASPTMSDVDQAKKEFGPNFGGKINGCQIVKGLVIGNMATLLPKKTWNEHTHSWTVYLRPYRNEDYSKFIKMVEFTLYESYKEPKRVITKPPYEIQETGWGEFLIPIKIHFRDPTEKPVTFCHNLHLSNEDSGKESYNEIVFKEPTRYMKSLLDNLALITPVTDILSKMDTGRSPKSSLTPKENINQNDGARKTVCMKVALQPSSSANSTASNRNSSRSPGSTDWRLNLQGVVPKWEYLLENELFTDVTFLVGQSQDKVKCHSLVLKMQSRHFETMLTPEKQEVEVPNCSVEVFKKMLKYLYTDKLDFTAADAMDALVLARQFHLTSLQQKCGRIVLEGINAANAAVLLNMAEDMGDKQLSLKVQEYILQYAIYKFVKHASQVVFTPGFKEISLSSLQKLLQVNRAFLKMAEVKILEAVKLWAGAECARHGLENTGPNQYQVAKTALDLIRFNQFTPMQFTVHVVKPKLLPTDKMLDIQSELIEKEESTKKRRRMN